ncbi:MAG: hypothetical protein M1823_004737 [Watsoniomyces obsoletus]|nr:MAG: hypothetical protein M1823_004737 [Watsoniomyces obsoletus]
MHLSSTTLLSILLTLSPALTAPTYFYGETPLAPFEDHEHDSPKRPVVKIQPAGDTTPGNIIAKRDSEPVKYNTTLINTVQEPVKCNMTFLNSASENRLPRENKGAIVQLVYDDDEEDEDEISPEVDPIGGRAIIILRQHPNQTAIEIFHKLEWIAFMYGPEKVWVSASHAGPVRFDRIKFDLRHITPDGRIIHITPDGRTIHIPNAVDDKHAATLEVRAEPETTQEQGQGHGNNVILPITTIAKPLTDDQGQEIGLKPGVFHPRDRRMPASMMTTSSDNDSDSDSGSRTAVIRVGASKGKNPSKGRNHIVRRDSDDEDHHHE